MPGSDERSYICAAALEDAALDVTLHLVEQVLLVRCAADAFVHTPTLRFVRPHGICVGLWHDMSDMISLACRTWQKGVVAVLHAQMTKLPQAKDWL